MDFNPIDRGEAIDALDAVADPGVDGRRTIGGMDGEAVRARVEDIAGGWRAERIERLQRRHLERRDFDDLRDAGLLTMPVPVDLGGSWVDLEQSSRQLCCTYRALAGADPSVALVSSMHPAVIGYWLLRTDAEQKDWEEQRRAVFESALAGEQWGTITSEPGSGGDIARTKATATPSGDPGFLPGDSYHVNGLKHFGSGSGIADRMVTTAIPDGEEAPALFALDVAGRPWDGTAGYELVAEWDGVAMRATQSHGMRLVDAPAMRAAWDGPIEDLAGPAVPLIAMLFTSVVLGVLDAAVAEARPRVAAKAEALRAYEQVEWTRAERDHWLARQAWDGAIRSVEHDPAPAATYAALRAKQSIADLAEDTTRRLSRVLGGGTLSASAPFPHWFEDVRALGFLRPPWALADDALFATSLQLPA